MDSTVRVVVAAVTACLLTSGCGDGAGGDGGPIADGARRAPAGWVVLVSNDLGMHCMNQDFSSLMVLPPYNTLRATVLKRGDDEPEIVTSGITLRYSIPGNTRSSTKTNFWKYAPKLLGVNLATDVGLAGNKLTGTFKLSPEKDWVAEGIPITPKTDAGIEDAYQLARVTLEVGGKTVATAQPVVPVSWELSCNLCHKPATGKTVDQDILADHDRLHGTKLSSSRPVTCGKCHAQPPLGLAGKAGLPSLSSAIHSAHAGRMAKAKLANECYACHPGVKTRCQRDVHSALGMDCHDCHISMRAVGEPSRRPWVDEPRCGTCHRRVGFEYEQRGKLFRQSRGHQGVPCLGCHGSPHALWRSTNARDNVAPLALTGEAGPIGRCVTCHGETPEERFPHRLDD